MADKVTLMGLKPDQVHAVVHGLAYMRTLTGKSVVGENYDNIFYVPGVQQLQPSSLSIGENYNHPQFVRWVADEEKFLYRQFDIACDKNKQSAVDWLGGARNAAYGFQQSYRALVENLNNTNQRMASALTGSLRTAATVQAVAEIALTVVGLFGAAAGAAATAVGGQSVITASLAFNTAAAGMTLKLGVEKMVVGIAGSLAIGVAETWTDARKADAWVIPMSVPGMISDGLKDFLQMRNKKMLDQIEAALKYTRGNTPEGYAARKVLKDEQHMLRKPTAVKTGTMGVVMTGAAWILAGWSIKDSLVKLYNRW